MATATPQRTSGLVQPVLAAAVLTVLALGVMAAKDYVLGPRAALTRVTLHPISVLGVFVLYWLAFALLWRVAMRASTGRSAKWWRTAFLLAIAFALPLAFPTAFIVFWHFALHH